MDKIEFINQIKGYDVKEVKKDFKNILRETKKVLDIDNDLSLSVTVCLNDYIHNLNKEYRNIDSETDVLSFAIEDETSEDEILDMMDIMGYRELGDIIINLDRVKSQAQEYAHDERREMCFLFVHGLLHLLGYDHMNKEEETEMFDLQEEILSNLSITR